MKRNASAAELLETVRMLESELIHLKNIELAVPGNPAAAALAISRPAEQDFQQPPLPATPRTEEKTVEILQIDEAEVEAELEELKRNAAEREKISIQNKPQIVFDAEDDIPTLAVRANSAPAVTTKAREIHELLPVNNSPSLNESLKKTQQEPELADTLTDMPVKDLKKAIGINERYSYINELFRGDEAMYERSIKTINGFAIFAEAEYWIRRELKLKLGWEDKNEVVRRFDQLVRRRFS